MHLSTHCHCARTVNIVIASTQHASNRQQGELIITGFGALNHILSTNVLSGATKRLIEVSSISLNPKEIFWGQCFSSKKKGSFFDTPVKREEKEDPSGNVPYSANTPGGHSKTTSRTGWRYHSHGVTLAQAMAQWHLLMSTHIANPWQVKGGLTSASSLFFLLCLIPLAAYSTTALPKAFCQEHCRAPPIPLSLGLAAPLAGHGKITCSPNLMPILFFMRLQVGLWLCEGGHYIHLDKTFSDKGTCSLQWAKGFSHRSLCLWLGPQLIYSSCLEMTPGEYI